MPPLHSRGAVADGRRLLPVVVLRPSGFERTGKARQPLSLDAARERWDAGQEVWVAAEDAGEVRGWLGTRGG